MMFKHNIHTHKNHLCLALHLHHLICPLAALTRGSPHTRSPQRTNSGYTDNWFLHMKMILSLQKHIMGAALRSEYKRLECLSEMCSLLPFILLSTAAGCWRLFMMEPAPSTQFTFRPLKDYFGYIPPTLLDLSKGKWQAAKFNILFTLITL